MNDELKKARAAIDAEKRTRVDACYADLKVIAKKHNCVIDAVPKFIDAGNGLFGVAAQIRVSARED